MQSKIINLGDYRMDHEDRVLRDMLAHPPLADDGFSDRVVRRIRRRSLLERWLLPGAAVAGGVIAVKPASGLLAALAGRVAGFGDGLGALASPPVLLPGGVLSALALVGFAALALRMLED